MAVLSNFSFFSSFFFLLDPTNGDFRWQFQTWHLEAKRSGQPSAGWWGTRKEMYVKFHVAAFSPSSTSLAYEICVFISTNTCIADNNFCFLAPLILPTLVSTSWFHITAELNDEVVQERHDDVIKFLLALIQDHYIVPEWQSFNKNYVGHDKSSTSKNAVFYHTFEAVYILLCCLKEEFHCKTF